MILDYLRLTRVFHHKVNNVGIYRKSTGQYIPSTALGIPDIICCIEGRYVGIEVKTLKGILIHH